MIVGFTYQTDRQNPVLIVMTQPLHRTIPKRPEDARFQRECYFINLPFSCTNTASLVFEKGNWCMTFDTKARGHEYAVKAFSSRRRGGFYMKSLQKSVVFQRQILGNQQAHEARSP